MTPEMLMIDGATGEGGGQILRSALALAMCLGRPFHMINIRAHRDRPGIRPQHLAAIRAAALISHAQVAGATPDNQELIFRPGRITPADYHFSIGTAGSAVLVLQTVLPVLLTADGPSHLTLEGGTHNPSAPSFDFLARAYLPLIARMGPRVRVKLERPGFFPVGGGLLDVKVQPTPGLKPLHLHTRGALRRVWAEVMLSKLARHIAEREMAVVREGLQLPPESVVLCPVENSPGPGNVVTVFVAAEHVSEVFTAYGRRGIPAEKVAREAVRSASRYLKSDVPIGPHLADQLLLPLALAGGGSFVTTEPSRHTTTNIDLIERFIPLQINCARATDAGTWQIGIR